jgi:hypothetical protein
MELSRSPEFEGDRKSMPWLTYWLPELADLVLVLLDTTELLNLRLVDTATKDLIDARKPLACTKREIVDTISGDVSGRAYATRRRGV